MSEQEKILEEIEAEIQAAKGEPEDFEIEITDDPVKEAKEEVFRDSSPRGADGKLRPIGLSMKVSI